MKKNKSTLSRREFLQNSAKLAVVMSASGLVSSLPAYGSGKTDQGIARRRLGKTGLDVSILGFGGGSQFLMNPNGEWEKVMEAAIEGGINIFDTAPSYTASSFNQGGSKSPDSEDRFGIILPKYRDKIILSTKLESRNPEEAKSELEASLKRLKTDHLDILFIHAILPTDSTAEIEKGLYKTMISFKSSGMVKNIGFSSMDSAERAKELLEKLDFDVVLLALNATKYGDFEKTALPAALKKNTGVIAMKAMRDIVGKNATSRELLEHTWSLKGVSTVFVGHNGLQTIQENIRLAKEFSKTGISRVDREELEQRMAGLAGPHALSWARPGYRDAGLA
jgi:aryl-alcohol dehydrogenase-like predicted oxidoreductase